LGDGSYVGELLKTTKVRFWSSTIFCMWLYTDA